MQTPLNVGVDVAGKKVVVACAAHSFVPRTVANERGALRAWLKELPGGGGLGVEAPGVHHQLLGELAHAGGLPAYVLNPRDVKNDAEGLGAGGKTDRLVA